MSEKIKVLDIDIDDCTAKQAMKATVEYMKSEPVNVIELMTIDALMYAKQEPELKTYIEGLDLILPGEQEILEAAGVTERRRLEEVESQTYHRMFLRYLHKNHHRIFLLVETDDQVQEFYEYFAEYYSGIQVAGIAKVPLDNCADDMVVNAINGGEVDCVIAVLPVPLQEKFIVRNRSLLNARIWLGVGNVIKPVQEKKISRNSFLQFVTKWFFRREIEKNRREMQAQR